MTYEIRETEKYCPGHLDWVDKSEFYTHSRDGLRNMCKECSKQAARGYHETAKVNFVYSITCRANNRKYFGSSTLYPILRFGHHKSTLKGNYHHNQEMQDDYNQFGLDTFIFEILEEFDEIEIADLLQREQYYMDNCQGELYNQVPAVAI